MNRLRRKGKWMSCVSDHITSGHGYIQGYLTKYNTTVDVLARVLGIDVEWNEGEMI